VAELKCERGKAQERERDALGDEFADSLDAEATNHS
jgi:hypothetical protein